jgi:hypothetical protein
MHAKTPSEHIMPKHPNPLAPASNVVKRKCHTLSVALVENMLDA